MARVWTRNARIVVSVAARALAALALLVFVYGLAGRIGGAIPSNAGWRPPVEGITIYVEDNGVHTGIIVPKVAAGVDWRGMARAQDLADPAYAAFDYLSFGWGEARFYRETPTWWDVRPATILAAAVGSDETLVHVDHLPRPELSAAVHALVIRPEEYRRLAGFIHASLKPGGRHYPGYFEYDAFYEGRGHYDVFKTCNAWTGEALRFAGVRIGAWTPFPRDVMQWL